MTTIPLGINVTSNAERAAVDLDKFTAAAGRAERGAENFEEAAGRAGRATGQMGINTANIAAQLQDIAVSAQMGMSPLTIALQQGTQLSAAFGQNGLRGTVNALGAAFASVISPVSLLTIGIIALGTFGVQALGQLIPKTENATDAFKRHKEELDDIVSGYGQAEDAIGDFGDAMNRLPQGVAQVELGEKLAEMNAQIDALEAKAASLGPILAGGFGQYEQELGKLLVQYAEVEISSAELATELTKLNYIDMGPLGFALKGLIGELLEGAKQAAAFENALVNISHALAGTTWSGGVATALESMVESKRSAELHQIELDALKAKTPAQERDIAMRRERLKLVDEEITEALKEQKVQEAGELAFERARARAVKTGSKDADQWEQSRRDFQRRIDQVQTEIDLFGQSTYEITKQKAAIDLLNEARRDGIPITDQVERQIESLSEEYARATAELEVLQFQQSQIDALNQQLASGFADLFIGIIDGSKSAEQGIADLLGSLGRLLINQAFQTLIQPAGSGGLGFNPFGMLFGGGRASGGPVEAGKIYKINENTPKSEFFAPAVNGTVIPANDNAGNAPMINITNVMQVMPGATEEEGAAFARGVSRELKRQLPDALQAYERNPLRRQGG